MACLVALTARAQVFGTVRVQVRDPQALVLDNVDVLLRARGSTWQQSARTNGVGEAVFPAVPIGQYSVSASSEGFETLDKQISVTSNTVTPVQMLLSLAGFAQTVDVSSTPQTINPESIRTTNIVDESDILRQPDGDRSGSMAMITNNTPGAYMMHDHLHSRGGHGVTWQIDGVPVPNSNLAAVGAQFDPKDVSVLEVNRGGLSTNNGDRAYGVFNIVPRSGFESDKFADAVATFGSFKQANGYFSFGDHTDDQKFGYFASGSGNRTDRALERVDIPVYHDTGSSGSAFTSMQYNRSMLDQFRFVGAARTDHYEVPNTRAQQLLGIADREVATDAFGNLTWVHASPSGLLVTVSPYYHYNRGQYLGGSSDPLETHDDRSSHYAGGYVNFAATKGPHTIRFGTDSFAEHDDSLFGLTGHDGSGLSLTETQVLWAGVVSAFVEDSYRVAPNVTLNGGVRVERFDGTLTEHAVSPRAGVALNIPKLGVLRGSFSRYYQHPQTSTIAGPVLQFALKEGFGFLPVPGEGDEVWEVGLGIPVRGWTLDFDAYHNKTKNAVDHEVLGNSNLLFPLTIQEGRVRAFESTLRSPRLAKRLRLHYAFAYQIAEGKGDVTGGLTDFKPPPNEYFYLDHDQRVTITGGPDIDLPWKTWATANVIYGSGFLRGNGPDHMPSHTTVDVAAGKDFRNGLSLRFSVLNATDALFLTGFENSFAGTHYANPREFSVQLRYKFHF
jgi:outer membrane receptor for ferrienterochelin and colicin